MKEGKDMATIYERILEKDSATRLAADFIQKHLILRRGVIMQDIQGFIDYFKKTL
jgi:hypothetical protein